MVCKKCGAELIDGMKFCTACGAAVAAEQPMQNAANQPWPQQPQQPQMQAQPPFGVPQPQMPVPGAVKQPKDSKKTFCGLGMGAGVLSVIGAILVYMKDVGYYEMSHSYGGDAYTGIQQAAAQAANNAMYSSEILKTGLAIFLLSFGVALIAYFGAKMQEIKQG